MNRTQWLHNPDNSSATDSDNAAFTSADIVTVFAASAVAARAKVGGWLQRSLKWLGGSILIGLGGKLALDND